MKTFVKFFPMLSLVLLLTGISNAETIFGDNFNVTGSGDVNYQIDEPGRQSGTAATLMYNLNGIGAYVTNAGPYAGKCVFESSTSISPNHNFNESGNYSIEYEITRTEVAGGWVTISLGNNHGNVYPWHDTEPGFCIVVGDDGGYSVWDHGTPTSGFNFAELSWSNNPTIKVKVVVSQGGFPPTQDARIGLFFNDKPYPLFNVGGYKFTYNYIGGFTNNYISLLSWTSLETIDNLKISSPDNNPISTAAWTDDADSGISSSKLYTHKVNFATSTNITVNGVTFDGSPSNLMAGANWELRTETPGGVYAAVDLYAAFGNNFNVAPQSQFLITNILYDGINSGGLTLSGLEPGKSYTITLYSIGNDYDAPNGRPVFFSTSDGGVITLENQNEFGINNGQILTYSYIAPESGVFSIAATQTDIPTAVWVWYAFSNELSPPNAPSSITASQGDYADKINVSWSAASGVDTYSLLRSLTIDTNDAIVVSDSITTNVFDDTTAAQATYYYYWVKACNIGGCSSLAGPALGFTKSSTPPDKPTNTSPTGFSEEAAPVTLSASAYSDPGSYVFSISRWQLSDTTDFSTPIWDSGDINPVTSLTLSKNATSSVTNYWRVRYKNEFNTWSDWSDETSFILTSAPIVSATVFLDTFSVSQPGNVNTDYNLPCRQSGVASPAMFTYSGTTKLGASSSIANWLEFAPNSACSPNNSFQASSNFKIEFDVNLHNFDGSADWLSCSFGKDDNSDLWPVSDSGLATLFAANSGFQMFDGNNQIATFSAIPTGKQLHILITANTLAYDEEDPVYCSVFVDGTPQIIENSVVNNNHLFYYTKLGDFNKNYVAFFNFNSAGSTTPSLIDNFKITAAPTNFITVHQWTGDGDSLIDGAKSYTHLANFNGLNVDINGKTFIGTGTILTNDVNYNGMTTNGWTLFDSYYWVAFRTETVSSFLSGGSKDIGEYGVIGAGTIAVTLHGLTPNSSNTLYLYTQVRVGAAGTYTLFQNNYFGAGEFIDVDEFGDGSGMIIQIDYIADKNGKFTVMASPKNVDNRFYLCGLANLETAASEPEINVDCSLDFGEVVIAGSKILPLEIRNIGGGEADGTISGYASPFSLATNNYYAVPAANDSVSVTFEPDEGIAYTNVITLTGNGGTAQVTLYGTGVPEPGIIWIIGLLELWIIWRRK